MPQKKKVAIIGTGISGLTCAWLLKDLYDIEVFESEPKIGGHTATVKVDRPDISVNVDTGFIVFNDWTYPNFIKLLSILKVKTQKSTMSFSVMRAEPELEYSGSSFKALFCQKRNFLRWRYWKMLLDITRFNKKALSDVSQHRISNELTLGDYLTQVGVGKEFIHDYLVPMGSAIWSTSNNDMLQFSALFFVEFFKNHGLLSIKNRPQWHVVSQGSSAYLEPLTHPFKDKIITLANITSVSRSEDSATLEFFDGTVKVFDQVVFACHSDQALTLLKDSSDTEKQILGAIQYKKNEVILHTDDTVLPKRKQAWASWNYRLSNDRNAMPILSYYMNQLQSLNSKVPFIVTLNAPEIINKEKVIATFNYSHPQFTLASKKAQGRWSEINGPQRTWFCGAYWGSGFHEDGCLSGIKVAQALGAEWHL